MSDIGSAAIDRSGSTDIGGYTNISWNNKSDVAGVITSFEIWANVDLTAVKIGTFTGNNLNWASRDYESIGNVPAGSKQTFTGKSCEVGLGDAIGIVATTGKIDYDATGGSGHCWLPGDQFGTSAQEYNGGSSESVISMYGSGTNYCVRGGGHKIIPQLGGL